MKLFTKLLFFLFALIFYKSSAQTADFVADIYSGCNPLYVHFTDKSTGTTSGTTYSWDFGDSKTSVLASPSTTYIATGTYTVRLTVKTGSGPSSSKTATINVYPSPIANYTSVPISGCPCTNVTFTNTSVANAPGAYTTVWSFGDGYTATSNNTTHLYCASGSYNVALKVTNSAGCENTRIDSSKVIIFEKPKGDFSTSKVNLCKVPDTVSFNATATKGKSPYTYSWDFGDGGTSTLSNPVHNYSLSGIYTVTMIVTDANGCKDTLTKLNLIKAVPMNSTFKVPASICAGTSLVMFENTSTPSPLSTKWVWSDGGGATGLNPQRNFWTGGTYTITMIDSFGLGCKDTAVNTYKVNPKPKANFKYDKIYPCPAPVNITFTNKSSGADSFLWVFGDGSTSKLKNPVHTYTHDSIFTVYLIVKDSLGCMDTSRVRDTTKAFPGGYPNPYYDSTNAPVIIRIYDGYATIKVDSPSGCLPLKVTASVKLFTHTHLPSAEDTSKLFALCSPIKGYSSPPYWYCVKVFTFKDPYPDEFFDPLDPDVTPDFYYPYKIKTYAWDFGDGFTSTLASPVHTYTTEGRHKITVTVLTDSNCAFTDSFFVETGNKPHADFSFYPNVICKNDYVYCTNLSTGGIKYTWDFGDAFTLEDTSKFVNHQYKVAGNRRILLVANRYGCVDTISKPVTINPPSSFFGIKYSCDTPLKVSFIDSSYRPTSWFWRFGDGATSTLRNPVHIYSDTGTYAVSLITTNDSFGCRDSLTRYIQLFKIQPTFTAVDSDQCFRDTFWLTNTSSPYIAKIAWSTSDTGSKVLYDSVSNKYFVVFRDTGIYSVTLLYQDIHKCSGSYTRSNYLAVAKPFVKFVPSPLLSCFPSTINFTDSSTNTKGKGIKNVLRTWLWGDLTSTTDTSIKASKSYSSPGAYTVKLIVTDNLGCKDSNTLAVESRRPKADFTALLDTFTCIGRANEFFNKTTGVGLNFFWDFGDGIGSSTLPNPVYTYKTIGTFNVKLVVTDATGCKDSLTKTAYVKTTKPTASFTMSDSIALCPPLFVSFTNTSTNAIAYSWDFDNGSTATIPSPVTPYVDSGVYRIVLVAFDKHGCNDTAFGKARVLGYDGAIKYAPLKGCKPLTVDFEAELINAKVMIWDFADGYTESAVGKLKTSHTYTTPGYYIPSLILGDGKGCSTSSKGLDTIKVDGITPIITYSPACVGTSITLNDSSYSFMSSYLSSIWTFDDASKSTSKNPIRVYPKAGAYTIKLVNTNTNGCIDSVTKAITVYDLPKIKAKDTLICLGDQATLLVNGAVSYTWIYDPTLSCIDCASPTTSTKVPIKYIVFGTDEHGCTNKDTLDVGIKTKTTLILAKAIDACAQRPIQLVASGAQKYLWTPATFLNDANISNPIATPDSTIIYRVIGSEGSCIPDTGFIKVVVHPLPEVNAGTDQKVLAGTSVQLNGSSKIAVKYTWTPTDSLSCSDCANPVAKPLVTTIYTLKGTTDFGCSDSDDVVIVVFCDQSQLFIPNTFTPNGDGLNDYFYPQGKGVGKIKSFIVYNRWGQKVYERTNIEANIKEQGWDGTFKGEAQNPDTFVYTLEATCDNGETIFWKSDVTLIK
ncbi:MAG: PKD domain-containing protein [Phycisphaerales bacterium]|nr:PKD domain-containing protein [Phycisphaerales bacterium]